MYATRKEHVRTLRDDGLPCHDIARLTGIPRGIVRDWTARTHGCADCRKPDPALHLALSGAWR